MLFANTFLLNTCIAKDKFSVFVVDIMAAHKSTSRYDISYAFSLYLYPPATDAKPRKADLFGSASDPFADQDRIENIVPAFRQWLDMRLGCHQLPEALLGYIYAILHAPAYCTAYADFLRSDFPRIPFPESNAAFVQLAELGSGLIDAHLLRVVPKRGLGGFTSRRDERVDAVRYSPLARGRININGTQGFVGVPPEI